jgi:hypothetical protein
MMMEVTEKTFYKQLGGSAAGAMVATGIGLAIVAFCGIFCGTQLGWAHLLTIVFLILTAGCIGLFIFFIVKAAHMKQHPTFQRYGSAAFLAGKINDGLMHPRYIAQTLADNVPFATLLTNDFIVNGVELVSYTELKDIRSVQPTFIPRVHRVVIGDPLMTAASLAANYAGDKYLESKGVNSETQFDYLMMECADGKKWQYGVQHKDLEAVLNLLQEIAPHIRFIPPTTV